MSLANYVNDRRVVGAETWRPGFDTQANVLRFEVDGCICTDCEAVRDASPFYVERTPGPIGHKPGYCGTYDPGFMVVERATGLPVSAHVSTFHHKWMAASDEATKLNEAAGWSEPEIHQFTLPAKFEVCDVCSGKGSHVNPSIDCDGLSSDDFDEDPDFREDYFSGAYDVTCGTCKGQRVVPVVDTEACDSPALQAALILYLDRLDDEADHARECRSERAMGA